VLNRNPTDSVVWLPDGEQVRIRDWDVKQDVHLPLTPFVFPVGLGMTIAERALWLMLTRHEAEAICRQLAAACCLHVLSTNQLYEKGEI
jgi:hypothetical protein